MTCTNDMYMLGSVLSFPPVSLYIPCILRSSSFISGLLRSMRQHDQWQALVVFASFFRQIVAEGNKLENNCVQFNSNQVGLKHVLQRFCGTVCSLRV